MPRQYGRHFFCHPSVSSVRHRTGSVIHVVITDRCQSTSGRPLIEFEIWPRSPRLYIVIRSTRRRAARASWQFEVERLQSRKPPAWFGSGAKRACAMCGTSSLKPEISCRTDLRLEPASRLDLPEECPERDVFPVTFWQRINYLAGRGACERTNRDCCR
jgi:hypothetical protein